MVFYFFSMSQSIFSVQSMICILHLVQLSSQKKELASGVI